MEQSLENRRSEHFQEWVEAREKLERGYSVMNSPSSLALDDRTAVVSFSQKWLVLK